MTHGLPLLSLPAGAVSPYPSAVAAALDQFKAELDPLLAPTKLADEKIGDQDCYHVQIKVNSSDIPQASGVLNGPTWLVMVYVWTRKSDSTAGPDQCRGLWWRPPGTWRSRST